MKWSFEKVIYDGLLLKKAGTIARGRSNKEIARELGVAPETIKTHLKRIFQKLSAESRAQAVVRAQSLGMLKTNGAHQAAL